MKCSKCGQESDTPLTILVNVAAMKPDFLCSRCMAAGMAKSFRSVKKLDKMIAEYEKLAQNMEDIIRSVPEKPKMPKGLEAFAHTPLTAYKDIHIALAELKSRRMELLIMKNGEYRLQYELDKSLEAEDYERSAALRDKLNRVKNGKAGK